MVLSMSMHIKNKQVGGTHYLEMAIQPFEIMSANFTHEQYSGFLMGCILKRLLRWQKKDGINDLRKMRHELDELIKFETECNDESR